MYKSKRSALFQDRIKPEYFLMSESGRLDDTVNMHEQEGKATSEVREVSFSCLEFPRMATHDLQCKNNEKARVSIVPRPTTGGRSGP